MATLLEMPRLSDTMREGTIVKWSKKVGDMVESGQVLAEIETDKAVMEYEALESGVLRAILVPDGGTVEVGAPIAIFTDEPDEDFAATLSQATAGSGPAAAAPPAPTPAPSAPASTAAPTPPAPAQAAAAQPAVAAATAPAPSPAAAPAPRQSHDNAHRISPLAARLAAEAKVDWSTVKGTGPHGRIIKRDILVAQTAKRELPAPPAPTGFAPAGAEYDDAAASQMRRTIAERLLASKNGAPHFYLTISIDMAGVLALRQQINSAQSAVKVSVNDLIVKAAALACRKVPQVNASWVDHEHPPKVRRYRDVHVGVAVAIEDGLVTPVLRHADRRSLTDLATETRELVEKAKARRLAPEAYQGNTITISNLGMFGIDEFTAIINTPASIILAVGQSQEVPVVVNGEIKIGQRMKVTLSCDHRVVDGALGAQWLAAFKSIMENPLNILV